VENLGWQTVKKTIDIDSIGLPLALFTKLRSRRRLLIISEFSAKKGRPNSIILTKGELIVSLGLFSR
jgi:hypothetical protein